MSLASKSDVSESISTHAIRIKNQHQGQVSNDLTAQEWVQREGNKEQFVVHSGILEILREGEIQMQALNSGTPPESRSAQKWSRSAQKLN